MGTSNTAELGHLAVQGLLLRKMRVERTETQTLPEDATRRHVFLCFYLCEVEGAGKNENVHQVDEAL